MSEEKVNLASSDDVRGRDIEIKEGWETRATFDTTFPTKGSCLS